MEGKSNASSAQNILKNRKHLRKAGGCSSRKRVIKNKYFKKKLGKSKIKKGIQEKRVLYRLPNSCSVMLNAAGRLPDLPKSKETPFPVSPRACSQFLSNQYLRIDWQSKEAKSFN